MKFDLFTGSLAQSSAECLVVGVHEGGQLTAAAVSLDRKSGGALSRLIKRGDFSGRQGDMLWLTGVPKLKAARVLLVGQGASAVSRRHWRKQVIAAVQSVAKTRVKTLAMALTRPEGRDMDDYLHARSWVEAIEYGLYRVNHLKSKDPSPKLVLEKLSFGPVDRRHVAKARRGIAHGVASAQGSQLMRNLANLPGNVCTPSHLAEQALRLGQDYPALKVRILDEAEIRAENMGCFLSVTQGSAQPPKFIIMEYRSPKAARAPVVLVGKGITFDTGGISLKDPGAMDEMKFDMSGAAAVFGAIKVVTELNLSLNVTALIPTCENMPGSRATKPGDIVTSAAGLTVEILNTDAEGRLILCDALHYARRYKPQAVIDLATLTGACVIALGHHHTGIMANDDALAEELVSSGLRADDRAWQLPLTEEYGEQLRSNFADFANVAGRDGGAITAAAFLAKFTEGLRWAHMDIAGSTYVGGAQKGSTGRPIALLTDFLIRRARNR
ncbi:MAG: leucyl aminopeptidase [Gammaproteobacteria bacterium]|jgi:leucyl aminopeptidase|nr:leucyl aminopeptidase [Gammaproteobacteria bacterium]